MRIVHLSTRDSLAGAFRAANRLHYGLQQAGLDSLMLVARKYSQDPTVSLPTATLPSRLLHAIRMVREQVPLRAYPNRRDIFSPAVASANLHPVLRRLAPDVIHLHWLAHGFVRPEDFATWQRPLVWTMHDVWPFTGGCHINLGCTRYEAQCGCCPVLASQDEHDLSHQLWQRKMAAWQDLTIHFVALSTWAADSLRASSLGARHPIHVIPNGIDGDLFRPQPKAAARQQLGLPTEKKIILFGAMNLTDSAKGYPQFVAALERLAAQPDAKTKHIVTFGSGDARRVDETGMATTHLGFITDDQRLATIYSAADVMVVPSLQENFVQTAAEALACGVPVVCFDATGLKDAVEHQRCGYRATPFSSDDLADGITWVLADDARYQILAARARAKVLEQFTLQRVAAQYQEIYSQLSQQ